jgi:hypothetical protein
VLRNQDREALQRIVSLARMGMNSAPAAMQNAGPIGELASALFESMDRRWTPNRIVTVPFTQPIVVGTTPLVTQQLTFPAAGRVVGVRGIVREGPDQMTHVSLQVLDQDGLSFVQNGRGADFVSLANLQAMSGRGTNGLFPMEVDVKLGEIWNIAVKSTDTSGTLTYTPEIIFAFEQRVG